jgi:hypothetical protein
MVAMHNAKFSRGKGKDELECIMYAFGGSYGTNSSSLSYLIKLNSLSRWLIIYIFIIKNICSEIIDGFVL